MLLSSQGWCHHFKTLLFLFLRLQKPVCAFTVCGSSNTVAHTTGLVERVCSARQHRKMVPFLLFAYRKVPQLYRRDVRGPLGILKESWCAVTRMSLLMMRQKKTGMIRGRESAHFSQENRSWCCSPLRYPSLQPYTRVEKVGGCPITAIFHINMLQNKFLGH